MESCKQRWGKLGFTTRFVSVNGLSLHQAEGDDGDPVVLLHGYSTFGRKPKLTRQQISQARKPKKRRRFHFHFTPTSSSWLNQVERFFPLITERMIRRGTFHSAGELETAIYPLARQLEWRPHSFCLESLCRRHARQGETL